MDNVLQGMMGNFSQEVIEKVAKEAGVDAKTASKILEQMAPAMAGALGKQAETEEGAQTINDVLSKHDGSVFKDLESASAKDLEEDGSKILGHVFGSKTEQVEQVLEKEAGTDKSSTMKMMSTFAPLILGSLGKQKSESGLDLGSLAGMLGGGQTSTGASKGNMIMGLLDLDNDGNVMDDVPKLLGYLKIAQKFLGGGKA